MLHVCVCACVCEKERESECVWCGSSKLMHQCPGCCHFLSFGPSFLPSPHPTSSASSFSSSLLPLLLSHLLRILLLLCHRCPLSNLINRAVPPPPSAASPSRLPSSALVGWPLPDIKVKSLPLPLLCLSFFSSLTPLHSIHCALPVLCRCAWVSVANWPNLIYYYYYYNIFSLFPLGVSRIAIV